MFSGECPRQADVGKGGDSFRRRQVKHVNGALLEIKSDFDQSRPTLSLACTTQNTCILSLNFFVKVCLNQVRPSKHKLKYK